MNDLASTDGACDVRVRGRIQPGTKKTAVSIISSLHNDKLWRDNVSLSKLKSTNSYVSHADSQSSCKSHTQITSQNLSTVMQLWQTLTASRPLHDEDEWQASFQKHVLCLSQTYLLTYLLVYQCRGGWRLSLVTLRQARLVPGWVTVFW